MKIVVMSDSHGKLGNLIDIGLMHKNADAFLFLGDGWRDFDDFKAAFDDKLCISVKGNCDLGCDEVTERIFELGGKKIFMAHGHMYGVKGGIGAMVKETKKQNCDIMLYGHTHIAYEKYIDGLYVFNPGSAGRGGYSGNSYGLIEITESGIMTSVVKIK